MTLSFILKCLGIFFLGYPGFVAGTQFKPWLPDMYVFEWRNSAIYQTYPFVAKGSHPEKFSGDDYFLHTSVCTSRYEYGLELEAIQAFTHCQKGAIDNLKATLRYAVLDDIAGDPLSLTLGMSYIQPFAWSLKDVSSFHHGRIEGEWFVSVGKEMSCGETWINRWWSMAGIGLADRGSPWVRFNIGYDLHPSEKHEWNLFCHTLWGLGSKNIEVEDFKGYGVIEHQSVNLGFRYTYLIKYFGSISFEYSSRFYARNFPAHANIFLLELRYDFGLL